MSIGAAIRITSPDEAIVIEHAAAFAQQRSVPCFVISYGTVSDDELDVARRNLEIIAEHKASPVMQEGDNVVRTLFDVARLFGVHMMFLRRPIAEQILPLDPPFDVVVVGSE